jgi:hypothetical protein
LLLSIALLGMAASAEAGWIVQSVPVQNADGSTSFVAVQTFVPEVLPSYSSGFAFGSTFPSVAIVREPIIVRQRATFVHPFGRPHVR